MRAYLFRRDYVTWGWFASTFSTESFANIDWSTTGPVQGAHAWRSTTGCAAHPSLQLTGSKVLHIDLFLIFDAHRDRDMCTILYDYLCSTMQTRNLVYIPSNSTFTNRAEIQKSLFVREKKVLTPNSTDLLSSWSPWNCYFRAALCSKKLMLGVHTK